MKALSLLLAASTSSSTRSNYLSQTSTSFAISSSSSTLLRQPNFKARSLEVSTAHYTIPAFAHQRKTVVSPLAMSSQENNDSQGELNDAPTTEEDSLIWKAIAAIGSTTSLAVSVSFFLALAIKRDALMVSFFMGSILNAILGKVLKKVLNQERPAELDTVEMKLKPSDNGMPSSHATSLGFIGTFTALCFAAWWTRLLLVLYIGLSLVYRVHIKLHTTEQVVVGLILGSTNGALWKLLCDGNNPLGFNMMTFVSENFLNESGVLPLPMLIVPALVGVMVVGSIERRIAGWMKAIKAKEA